MDYLIEKKQHEQFNYRAEFGTANVQVRCPFCSTVVKAYIWSMAGGGKKCPGCGAIHTGHGLTFKKTKLKSPRVIIDGKAGEYTYFSGVTGKHHFEMYDGSTIQLTDIGSVKFDIKQPRAK